MQATVSGVKISGMCSTVPDNVQKFEDDMKHFPFSEKSSLKLAKVMGFKEHRVSDPQTAHCNLATYTLNYMIHKGYINRDIIQAMIVVSQSQDHPVPGNSKVIHGLAELPRSVYCMDLYENCIGFISGLYAACSIISGSGVEEVLNGYYQKFNTGGQDRKCSWFFLSVTVILSFDSFNFSRTQGRKYA